MADRRTVDLQADPPPDLAVETEYCRSVVDKISIYGALGAPEVCRSCASPT